MTATGWRTPFLGRLVDEGIAVRELSANGLAPARAIVIAAAHWGQLAKQAKLWDARFVAGWAEDRGDVFWVHAAFEKDGRYLLARTEVPRAKPLLPSQTPHLGAADRPERHTQDLFGIQFEGHPDPRRWTRHQAWGQRDYPLRKDFPLAGRAERLAPPDDQYAFVQAQGEGVYEIPVGPVHAGIIEPGHFRFQALGESILNLEERLGYVHKGIEKIADGRDATGLAKLAARVSGDATVAHTWAACMAMEKASGCVVTPRALALRAVMAERERIANHVGDIGAICNDVAFSFVFYQCGRLREDWQRLSQQVFGHRLMMDRIVPGGVAVDVDDHAAECMRAQHAQLRRELTWLRDILEDMPTLEDRLVTTGELTPALAKQFGTLGFVARASGIGFDLRKDAPYAPYDRLTVTVPVYHYGDVASRVRVRLEEALVALDLLDELLLALPSGPIAAPIRAPDADAEGLGLVEGWRGETLAYVRFGDNGKIARYFPRDPSVANWPALEKLARDNIVPDFPVCNKSVNGSYSGNDL